MFKKNLFLICALSIAYAPVLKAEDEGNIKGHCKKFNNIRVCNNGIFGGSVTAQSFITPNGPLFNGLRNYAVFSNQSEVDAGQSVILPFAATPPTSISAGIANTAGIITLPATGIFLVMYTVRITFAPGAAGVAFAQLEQTVTGSGSETAIGQPAVVENAQTTTPATEDLQIQLSGYAIVITNSTLNNQIDLRVTMPASTSIPPTGGTDANAQLTILQLN